VRWRPKNRLPKSLLKSPLKKILKNAEIMPPQEFDKFLKEAEKLGKNIENYLIEKKIISLDKRLG
jgi:hypothetical protein